MKKITTLSVLEFGSYASVLSLGLILSLSVPADDKSFISDLIAMRVVGIAFLWLVWAMYPTLRKTNPIINRLAKLSRALIHKATQQ